MNDSFSSKTRLFQYDVWNKWTEKSFNVSFNSQTKGIGDGENKLGAEFDAKPLGQNYSYDLYINGEKWEIKKLDSDNSFRLGVEISPHYTTIISKVIRILEQIEPLTNKLINSTSKSKFIDINNQIITKSGNSSTYLIDGLRKNEVSASNLEKANNIIESLKEFKIDYSSKIKLYNSLSKDLFEYKLQDAFIKLSVEPITVKERIKIFGSEDTYNTLLILNNIGEDLFFFKEKSLKQQLNDVVRNIFAFDIKLVLVHSHYGFKPLKDISKIYCNRITSGLPRCKVND